MIIKVLVFLFINCVFQQTFCVPIQSPVEGEKKYEIADELTNQYWNLLSKKAIEKARNRLKFDHAAKNAILFLGDGMGISTLTAARVFKGQMQGKSGEEGSLHFENFPNTALIKTYNVNRQVPDSAGTATAYLTGVKGNIGSIGVNANVNSSTTSCADVKEHSVDSILEWARKSGKAIGVVTTTRITHATPAASYAHVAYRDYEFDAAMPVQMREDGCKDIAYQLIHNEPGFSLNVIMGGGRRNFLPAVPGDQGRGYRTDNRNLIEEWKQLRKKQNLTEDEFAYVETKEQLSLLLKKDKIKHVLGLFSSNHLEYEEIASANPEREEPTLTEMTEAAVSILKKINPAGFVLLVEGGRIDHAHHKNVAALALKETVEFDRAIEWANESLNPRETLIVVTADHSHGFTINGYSKRGNPILGYSEELEENTRLPFTTLLYASGPGNRQQRFSINEDTMSFNYTQYSAIKLKVGNHGGEDVALYSQGPMAHLFHSLQEQNYIAHVIGYATCIGTYSKEAHCKAFMTQSHNSYSWIYIVGIVMIVASAGVYFYKRR